VKDEWRRAGRATGELRCRMTLPAIEFVFERFASGPRAVTQLGHFLRSRMPEAQSTLEGGTFVISAKIRAPRLSVRWRPICRWRAGGSIEVALERASDTWTKLPKEERFGFG